MIASGDFTVEEMMSVCISREVKDWETAGCGVHSPIPAGGLLLAEQTHAPDVNLIIEGSSTHTLSTPDALHFMASRGELDLYCFSGIQIDRLGNLNMNLIGDPKNPKLRMPGAHALPLFYYMVGRAILFRTEHTRRSFVERVDFISGAGQGEVNQGRRGGVSMVVTPKAVLRWDDSRNELVLESVHCGATIEDVKENTGWDLYVAPNAGSTPPPTEEELAALRGPVRRELEKLYPDFVAAGKVRSG